LAELDFAGEHRNFAGFVDVNPGINVLRQVVSKSAATGFLFLVSLLGARSGSGNDEEDAEAERFDKVTTIQVEVVTGRGE